MYLKTLELFMVILCYSTNIRRICMASYTTVARQLLRAAPTFPFIRAIRAVVVVITQVPILSPPPLVVAGEDRVYAMAIRAQKTWRIPDNLRCYC